MKDTVVTFALASISKRSTVQFSPEGHDVVCALLVRWLNQTAESYKRAVEMERMADNPLLRGQADYWRNAGSFIKGKLYGHLNHKFNCYNELKELAKLNECGQVPEGWEPFEPLTPFEEYDDGTSGAASGGCGGDSTRENGNIGVDAGRGGAGDSGTSHVEGEGPNPPVGGKSPGAKPVGKRKKGAGADRGRGRQRKPASPKAGRNGGKVAEGVGD